MQARRRRPLGTIGAIAMILLLAAWAGAATAYVLFRDDALKLLADRQVALTRAHDREVGSLLTEIERLRSIKLLDQQRVERTLADLIRRQVLLEQRQAAFQALAPAMRSVAETTATIPEVPARAAAPKPSPLPDSAPAPERRTEAVPTNPLDGQLAELSEKLARAEATQTRTLARLESGYETEVSRMRSVLAELGFVALQPAPVGRLNRAIGGPFVPLFRADEPFEQQVARVRLAARQFAALSETFDTLPVRKPLLGETEISSGYGMRVDPFLRQLALHTGIDFRAEPGDLVRAVAAGKVTQAGYQGGYGLMVEIDHGNGLVTRYAHLSAIDVAEGATVPAGGIIGRTGTTGRSTGPHLHYEVRQNGEPVDPLRFLKAGARLQGF